MFLKISTKTGNKKVFVHEELNSVLPLGRRDEARVKEGWTPAGETDKSSFRRGDTTFTFFYKFNIKIRNFDFQMVSTIVKVGYLNCTV